MASNGRRYKSSVQDWRAPLDNTARASYDFPPTPDLKDPYYRRRTSNDFLPATVKSSPTVAKSSLTASATTNDLSHPPTKPFRSRFPLLKRSTHTRIPSPVWDAKYPRHVSTPVLPSQRTKKENMQHETHQLPGTKSPHPTLLPRSRTIGVLSNIATSFSRPSLSLGDSRHASRSSIHVADVTTSTPQSKNPNSNSYWCGRFQALSDRFHNELLLMDLEALREIITASSSSPSPPPTPPPATKAKGKAKSGVTDEDNHGLSTTTYEIDDQDKRSIRVFLHLQALCTTSEERRGLWEFQLHFARMEGKPHLLPSGGKMAGDRSSWIGRVSRAMGGGTNTGFGSRKSVPGMGKRKDSLVGFSLQY